MMKRPKLRSASFFPSGDVFNYGQWSLLQTIYYMIANDSEFAYGPMGVDPTKFLIGPTANSPSGELSGTQEELNDQYLISVICPWIWQNLQVFINEQISIGLKPYATDAATGWIPVQDVGVIASGLASGGVSSAYDCFNSLLAEGYDWAHAAYVVNQAFSTYSSWIKSNPRMLMEMFMPQFTGFVNYPEVVNDIDPYDGTVGALQPNTPYVPIGGESVWVPKDAAMQIAITNAAIQLKPTFVDPKANWITLLKYQMNPILAGFTIGPDGKPPQASPAAQYCGANVGSYYVYFAYNLQFGDSNDADKTLLEMTIDELTRFQAVPIEANEIANVVQGLAAIAKIAYSSWDWISTHPVSTDDVLAQRMSPSNYAMISMPRRLQAWYHVAYAGTNPLVAGTVPGSQTITTPDWNGQPKTSAFGVSFGFVTDFEDLWRSRMAHHAVTGGSHLTNFGAEGKDSSGNNIPSLYGAVIKFPVNSDDQTPALPYFDDNTQYDDLAGALLKGLANDRQYANVFDNLLYDLSLKNLLGIVQPQPGVQNSINRSAANVDVWNDFFGADGSVPSVAQMNNRTLRDSWLKQTPKPITPLPLVPVTNPNPVNVIVGPYGNLNVNTD